MWNSIRNGILLKLLLCAMLFIKYSLQEGCGNDEFDCGGHICIANEWRCDGEVDCPGEGTDELHCDATSNPRSVKSCTSNEFSCGNNSLCIPLKWKCDNDTDCHNGLDEASCNATCGENEFSCGDGKCLPASWVCDGQPDCTNESDEQCKAATCTGNEFLCAASGQCIADIWRCDGDNDCSDGSDELNCNVTKCARDEFQCTQSKECITRHWRCDGETDCEDHSDEERCTPDVIHDSNACGEGEFMCKDKEVAVSCIHIDWRCDSDKDCPDGSDEFNCTHTCATNQFKCQDNECISNELVCDGDIDCIDGSDEFNCTKDCGPNTLKCTGIHEGHDICLDGERVCDGTEDCTNFEDENEDRCVNITNPCTVNNGGCQQKCSPLFGNRRQCGCHEGYQLVGDHSCEDLNECEEAGRCSQRCTNVKGHFKCSCIEGYFLEYQELNGKRFGHCRVEGNRPYLLVANSYDIRQITVDSWFEKVFLEEINSPIAVDYDYNDGHIFWSDVQKKKIYRATKGSNDSLVDLTTVIKDNILTPDGIAVDWIYNHIYLTDAGFDRIEVATFDGQYRKTLVSNNLDEPRAIVVDPNHGWLYWTDWGKVPMISKCGMNNDKYQKVIVEKDILWPNGLTLDYVAQELYWIDAKMNKIMSSDTNGQNTRVIVHNAQQIQHPFAITVFEDNIYWTDWKAESVRKVNKFTGGNYGQVVIGIRSPMDIHYYHERVQRSGPNHCGNNNGGCSHLCLPSPFDDELPPSVAKQNRFSCACPDTHELRIDMKTCMKRESTTSKPNTTAATASPSIQTTVSEESTTKVVIITTEQGVSTVEPTVNQTEKNIPGKKPGTEQVGLIAGIVVVIVLVLFVVCGVIGYLVYRRYTKRNIKSMNFDNPVYKKTTEKDQCMISYGGQSRQDYANEKLLVQNNPEV